MSDSREIILMVFISNSVFNDILFLDVKKNIMFNEESRRKEMDNNIVYVYVMENKFEG